MSVEPSAQILVVALASVLSGCPESAIQDAGSDAGPAPMDAGRLATAGERCMADDDCESGECFSEAERPDFVGGSCIRPCRAGMHEEDCGEGRCIDNGRLFCQPSCEATRDCPPGRLCFPDFSMSTGLNPPRHCVPGCWRDDQCDSGVCDPYLGWCQAPSATGGGSWDACTVDADCKSDFCDDRLGGCVVFCPLDEPGPVCPEPDEVCVDDVGLVLVGSCRPRCTMPSECQTGRCERLAGMQVCN